MQAEQSFRWVWVLGCALMPGLFAAESAFGARGMLGRRRHLGLWVLLLLTGLGSVGCGSYMARRLVQAPNTYPSWFAPRAPVTLAFGANYLTNSPVCFTEVKSPPARLRYRIVEPADYHTEIFATNWLAHGRPQLKFVVHATVPGQPTGFTRTPRGTVVLLHSYGGSQTVMAPWALRLAQEGWRCVLVDLRGHGKATGRRIYFGVQEARDLSQLLDELVRQGHFAEPVAVVGHSYGAAVALRWKAVDPRVRAVAAIAPYAELAPAVLNVRREYAKWMPERCIRAGLNKLPGVLELEPGELDPTTVLSRNPICALFVAGGEDKITPAPEVERLCSLAAGESRLLVVPRATHEALPYLFDDLLEPVLAWLAGD